MTTALHPEYLHILEYVKRQFEKDQALGIEEAREIFNKRVKNLVEQELNRPREILESLSRHGYLTNPTSVGVLVSTNNNETYFTLPSKINCEQAHLVKAMENYIAEILNKGEVDCETCVNKDKIEFNTTMGEIGDFYFFKITPKEMGIEPKVVARELIKKITKQKSQPEELLEKKVRIDTNGLPYEFFSAWRKNYLEN